MPPLRLSSLELRRWILAVCIHELVSVNSVADDVVTVEQCFIQGEWFIRSGIVSLGGDTLARCPAGCAAGNAVWGSSNYTLASAVCAAAIHNGLIDDASGGVVRVVFPTTNLEFLAASTANGVTTQKWSVSDLGFTLVDGSTSTTSSTTSSASTSSTTTTVSSTTTSSGSTTSSSSSSMSTTTTSSSSSTFTTTTFWGSVITCLTIGHWFLANGARQGDSVAFLCPETCTAGDVYGSDNYTLQSVICSAATHAGIISPVGTRYAEITFPAIPLTYSPSWQNGIVSKPWSANVAGFTLRPGAEPTPAPTPVPTPGPPVPTTTTATATSTTTIRYDPFATSTTTLATTATTTTTIMVTTLATTTLAATTLAATTIAAPTFLGVTTVADSIGRATTTTTTVCNEEFDNLCITVTVDWLIANDSSLQGVSTPLTSLLLSVASTVLASLSISN